MSNTIYLSAVLLKNVLRQKTMVFSTLILPALIMWSTWWVTADLPMKFGFAISETIVKQSMIDVHVVSGALTSMGITAGLFGFIIYAENRKTSKRLELYGYTSGMIALASLLALFAVLIPSIVMVTFTTSYLTEVKNIQGLGLAVALVTITYASLGTLTATIIENVTEGTLFLLVFAFTDLMMLTNPMGGGIYLESWTYFMPGFWPVQLSMESAYLGTANLETLIYPGIYSATLILLIAVNNIFRRRK